MVVCRAQHSEGMMSATCSGYFRQAAGKTIIENGALGLCSACRQVGVFREIIRGSFFFHFSSDLEIDWMISHKRHHILVM